MQARSNGPDPRVSRLYADNVAQTGRNDIVLAGYGGAGQSIVANTLLQLGLNYVDPYTEIVNKDGTSTPVEEHSGFRTRMAAVSVRDRETSTRRRRWPRFLKTHLPPEVFAGRQLGGVWLVVRDPRDALHSWYWWRVAFGEEPWDRVNGDFAGFLTTPDYAGRLPTQDWAYFYSGWLAWAGDHGTWTSSRFEDLKADPVSTIDRALRVFGIVVDKDCIAAAAAASSFEAMRGHEDRAIGDDAGPSRMMRRGKVGEWREWMTATLAAPFADPEIVDVARRLGYSLTPAEPHPS